MRPEDFDKFQVLMTTLSELYDKSPSEAALKMYAIAFKDFSIEQITYAVERAITELKWFPKPAELIELIRGSAADRSEQAWETLWNAYLKAGYWDSVIFEDTAITKTVLLNFGGWVQLSSSLKALSPEMLQSERKRFTSTYKRESLQQNPLQRLPGYHELNNRDSVPQWNRDQFGGTYRQRIFIAQGNSGRFVDARFDRSTAQLIDSEGALLVQGKQAALPAKPKLELLPSPSAEARAMKPEQIKAGIEQLKAAMSGHSERTMAKRRA